MERPTDTQLDLRAYHQRPVYPNIHRHEDGQLLHTRNLCRRADRLAGRAVTERPIGNTYQMLWPAIWSIWLHRSTTSVGKLTWEISDNNQAVASELNLPSMVVS